MSISVGNGPEWFEVSLSISNCEVSGNPVLGVFQGSKLLGRTEEAANSSNFSFKTKLKTSYSLLSSPENVTFSLYDADDGVVSQDFIGTVTLNLSGFPSKFPKGAKTPLYDNDGNKTNTALSIACVGSSSGGSKDAYYRSAFASGGEVQRERTFIAIKPDGVMRRLIGDVIEKFESKGFQMVAMKLLTPSPDLLKKHYADLSKKAFFPDLVAYMCSGPVCAMVWEGKGSVSTGRMIVGATNPKDANPGSVRGDNCIDIGRNLIHGSDSVDNAKKEIGMWFNSAELNTYSRNVDEQIYE